MRSSLNGMGATLEQQTDDGLWALILFASGYLNVQEQKTQQTS